MKTCLSFGLIVFLVMTMLSGCQKEKNQNATVDTEVEKVDTSEMDFSFDDETSVEEESEKVDVSESSETQSVSINKGGSYTLSGVKNDEMVLVDAADQEVTLVLAGLTINNSKGPAIYVRAAKKVVLTLADGSLNSISDGSKYEITDGNSALDAAIFSRADLVINGSGSMKVEGNYKHGIVSKDELIISSGSLNVTSENIGLNGKDCVKINGGAISLVAGSDGIRVDNADDTSKGYVYILGGKLNIEAANDGIQAETVIKIDDSDLTILSGGGSDGSLTSSEESYKGLKAASDIYINGGKFDIQSRDDCIHSNGTITISGGNYALSSGDDGIHADTDLEISGEATILNISKSYEGIEATDLVIKNGKISICATDDGLNAAGGNDSVDGDGMMRPGMGHFSSSVGSITITGGDIYIEMSGDGIDANGTLNIMGGNINVSGADRGDTAILDFDTEGTISGGTFIGTGATGMAQNFSSTSAQGAIMVSVGSQTADTVVELLDENGKALISYTANRSYSCVVISHSAIKSGKTYTLKAGNSVNTITMNGTVYGSGGMGGAGGGERPGGGGRPGGKPNFSKR